MAYNDYLAARGYQRIIIERTSKRPGDKVLYGAKVETVRREERAA